MPPSGLFLGGESLANNSDSRSVSPAQQQPLPASPPHAAPASSPPVKPSPVVSTESPPDKSSNQSAKGMSSMVSTTPPRNPFLHAVVQPASPEAIRSGTIAAAALSAVVASGESAPSSKPSSDRTNLFAAATLPRAMTTSTLPSVDRLASPQVQFRTRSRSPSPSVSRDPDAQSIRMDTPMLFGPIPRASEKRNTDFHQLFRSVPEEEDLIEDYSCALQRDILIQGRIYITENYMCFNSNILGWVTNVVFAFTDVLSIERKTTAYVIPNAIRITTLHAVYHFATFLNREQTYVLMIRLWRLAMGDDSIGQLGVPGAEPLETPQSATETPEEAEQVAQEQTLEASPKEERQETHERSISAPPAARDDRGYDSDESSDAKTDRSGGTALSDSAAQVLRPRKLTALQHADSLESTGYERDDDESDASASLPALSTGAEDSAEDPFSTKPRPRAVQRKRLADSNTKHASLARPPRKPAVLKNAHIRSLSNKEPSRSHASVIESIPVSLPRTPVFCNCTDHGATIVLDRVFPISLHGFYYLLFGDPESGFLRKFLSERKGFLDVKIPTWSPPMGANSERVVTYTVPLKIALGPKSTRCFATQKHTRFERDQYVCIRESDATPDVPSGNTFATKITQCMMHAGEKETRMLVGFHVEFSKSSWIKGAIEKGAVDGNTAYWKDFEAEVVKVLASRPGLAEEMDTKAKEFFSSVPSSDAKVESGTHAAQVAPVPSLKATETSSQKVEQAGFWQWIASPSPLVSWFALGLTLINFVFLIWIYRLNARLDAITTERLTSIGVSRPAPVADVPEWWFAEEKTAKETTGAGWKADTLDLDRAVESFLEHRLQHVYPSASKDTSTMSSSTSAQTTSPTSSDSKQAGSPFAHPALAFLREMERNLHITDATMSSLKSLVLEQQSRADVERSERDPSYRAPT